MKFFFCDVCGTRVSDADLRAGMGVRRRHDVICATCLELGHGKAWSEDRDDATRAAPAVPSVAPVPAPVPADTPAPDSLAAAASGLGALDAVPGSGGSSPDVEDLIDAVPPAGQPATTSRSAKPASTRSSRSPARKSSKSAAASTREQRKAANDRRRLILIILVVLCLLVGGALAVLLFAPQVLAKVGIGGGKGGAGTEIRLKDVRDQLFSQVGETRRMAFRDPTTVSTAEVEATIARIHAMSDAIDAFGETAAKGGWTEEHVSSQLASWNVRDIMGKLRMWNDERAKRTASGK